MGLAETMAPVVPLIFFEGDQEYSTVPAAPVVDAVSSVEVPLQTLMSPAIVTEIDGLTVIVNVCFPEHVPIVPVTV